METAATTKIECGQCPALCCRDLSIRILRPRTKSDINDLKWQLQFDTVRVYVRNHTWYQLIDGRCMYLGDDNRCKAYPERPDICRKHNPPNCELFGDFYDVMMETPADLEAYLAGPGKRER
jgi:Fe-S-cluster containining protein